jgi:hypothetical protein
MSEAAVKSMGMRTGQLATTAPTSCPPPTFFEARGAAVAAAGSGDAVGAAAAGGEQMPQALLDALTAAQEREQAEVAAITSSVTEASAVSKDSSDHAADVAPPSGRRRLLSQLLQSLASFAPGSTKQASSRKLAQATGFSGVCMCTACPAGTKTLPYAQPILSARCLPIMKVASAARLEVVAVGACNRARSRAVRQALRAFVEARGDAVASLTTDCEAEPVEDEDGTELEVRSGSWCIEHSSLSAWTRTFNNLGLIEVHLCCNRQHCEMLAGKSLEERHAGLQPGHEPMVPDRADYAPEFIRACD